MTARELLFNVAQALRARGHKAMLGLNVLHVERQLVACAVRDGGPSRVKVLAAQVFDGHKHVVPPGCDASTVTPGSRYATVERIVAAIEKRMAARAKSLPVPVDTTAIVRGANETTQCERDDAR